MFSRIAPSALASGTTFPRSLGWAWRVPALSLAALALALIALAPAEVRADVVGGTCMTGAHTVSNGVVLKCVSSAWTATSIQLGDDTTTCAAGKSGAIRWSSSALQYCNGSAWTAMGGGGALSGLSDVTIASAANNDLLRYDSTASKWKNTPINTALGSTTMQSNWPDAVRCSSSTYGNGTFTLILTDYGRSDLPGAVYRASYMGAYVYVVFNTSGAYSTAEGLGTTDCANQSITQLYASGKAYNFLGNNGVTTFNAGTASAPGLAVTSDTNTGFWSSGADTLNVSTGGSERLRIGSTGNVSIATTSTDFIFTVAASGGTAYVANGGVWVNASDRRLKDDIKPIEYGLDTVMKLKPVSYTLKQTHEPQIGFIAQEVEEVVPELVGRVATADMKDQRTLSYDQMVAVTVRAIQELSRDRDELRQTVEQLRSEVDHLKSRTKSSRSR